MNTEPSCCNFQQRSEWLSYYTLNRRVSPHSSRRSSSRDRYETLTYNSLGVCPEIASADLPPRTVDVKDRARASVKARTEAGSGDAKDHAGKGSEGRAEAQKAALSLKMAI